MILVRAPMRISLFGGGTDYVEYIKEFGGISIGFAINQYSYVSSRPLPPYFDYHSRIAYGEIECVKNNNNIKHNAVRNAILYLGKEKEALEIQTWADVPSFTGLGSSSAFIVALLKSLRSYEEFSNPEYLINAAFHIERNMMGSKVGVQDCTFAAIGGIGGFRFNHSGGLNDIVIKYRFFPGQVEQFFNTHGLLFFTGLSRNSSDVVDKYVKNLVDNNWQHQIRDLAEKAYEKLLGGCTDLETISNFLNCTWAAKKKVSPYIMTPALQELENKVTALPITGLKLLGGGGGGSFFILAEPKYHEEIIFKGKEMGMIHIPYQICNGVERIL